MYKPLMALVASVVALSGALYAGTPVAASNEAQPTQISQAFPSTEVAGVSVSLGFGGGGYRNYYGGGYYPGYYYSTPYYYDNYYYNYPGYYYSTPYYYAPYRGASYYGGYGNSWGGYRGWGGHGGWGHHHR